MKFNLLLLSILIRLEVNLSAVLIGLHRSKSGFNTYMDSKTKIHIPTLLTMDTKTRNDICDQIIESDWLKFGGLHKIDPRNPYHHIYLFSETQLERNYPNRDLTEQPICPVSSFNLNIQEPVENAVAQVFPEIMMECWAFLGEGSDVELKSILVFYSRFKQMFFTSGLYEDGIQLMAISYLSPTYVPLNQKELEEFYLSFRAPLEKIRLKHPETVRSIENGGPLSRIPHTTYDKLCLSLLNVHYYKEKSIQFVIDERHNAKSDLEVMPLKFENSEIYPEQLTTYNKSCYCEKDGKEIILYVTQSFNEDNSVFVQRKVGENLVLDAYIRDIPFLMNLSLGNIYLH